LRRHVEDLERPAEFHLLEREWDLLPGVFAPIYTPVTELFTSWLPYPVGGDFLEMGCGAGVTAVMAALAGCRHVTATDISDDAVENTRRNARRHGVEDRLRVARSNLFDELPDERFDMIFWNSNFVEPPAEFVNETDLHHAFFDPGYDAHGRFLREAPRHLRDNGRLLLGFSDLGNGELLSRQAAEAGLDVTTVRAERHDPVEFQLLEFRPTPA
jgi:release factor glutamine methyltransferase